MKNPPGTILHSKSGKKFVVVKKHNQKNAPAKLSKPVKAAVKRLINAGGESKYCVSETRGSISTCPVDIITPTSWLLAMPLIAQGVQNNERIGERINGVRGKTTMKFYFLPTITYSTDVYIKIFYGRPRAVSSYPQLAAATAGTLLEVGNQTTLDWQPISAPSYPAVILDTMPVSRTNWILKTKTLRMTRNTGLANGSVAGTGGSPVPHTTNPGEKSFTWHWKHKPTIKYPDDIHNYPTNYCPVFAAVAWNADGSTITSGDIVWTYRSEVYYKDS